jgi:hypothetical protein
MDKNLYLINTGGPLDINVGSNENTLILEYDRSTDIQLKVEDGLIKIGFPISQNTMYYSWVTMPNILVIYTSPENEHIQIKWNKDDFIFINPKCMESMKFFFHNLVSTGKLRENVTRGSGIRYSAIA